MAHARFPGHCALPRLVLALVGIDQIADNRNQRVQRMPGIVPYLVQQIIQPRRLSDLGP